MVDRAKVKEFLRKLAAAYQGIKIYTLKHLAAQKDLEDIFNEISSLLSTEKVFSFGLLGDEIFYEDKIFFDLSSVVRDFVKDLKNRNIEKLVFKKGVSKTEVGAFFEILSASKGLKLSDIKKTLRSRNIVNIEIGELKVPDSNLKEDTANEGNSVLVSSIYNGFLSLSGKIIDDTILKGLYDLLKIEDLMINVFDIISSRRNLFLMILSLKKHDDYTIVHCINVAILSMLQAQSLGMSREDILKVGKAGFLHDIGKITVAKKILGKTGKLSDEEFKSIKSHTILGAKILLGFKNIDKEIVLAAYEHHLGIHCLGYPKMKFLNPPVLSSRIIALSDFYDALRSRRNYKEPMFSERVYEIMLKEKGRALDPDLFDNFFSVLGVWPVGTIVKLENGDVAIVVDNNPSDIFNPKVKVFFAGDNVLHPPLDLDLSNSQNKIISSVHSQCPKAGFIRNSIKV